MAIDKIPYSGVKSLDASDRKQDTKNEEIAATVIRDFQRRAGNRWNFESQWQEIAQRMVPLHNRNFNTYNQFITKGEKRTEFIFDSTASTALGRFASILDSLLTPRNQTWHRLMVDEPALQKSRQVRLYFEEVNRLLFKHRYAPTANFASQNQQVYKSLGAYGTSAMFIDELANGPGLRYKSIHLSQLFFSENHQGIVDDCVRYFPMTARQAYHKWGENIPDLLRSQLETNPDYETWFIHQVKPREDVDIFRADMKGMPYVSYYVSMVGRKLLSEGGFNTFPYAISRYEQAENEVYGRSPAMEVLPTIKTLNEQKKTMLKQGHRTVDPVLLAHDDGVVDNFSMKPGAINPGGVTADGRPLIHALPVGNLSAGQEVMNDDRQIVKDAFLVTIFQILTETPAMTATEVLERTREKGILLAPTIGRQQSEYLGPMIEREVDVLSRQGILPPMPMELKQYQAEYRIEYDSPLSRAQRSEEASGVMRTLETALNIAAQMQDPSVLDNFNLDVIIPQLADIQGVPESWMNGPDVVAQRRQGRAQQAQQQQTINALPNAASMIKSVAAAKKAGGI